MDKPQFKIPSDGFVPIMPFGEYPHAGAGVTQVLDNQAADSILSSFNDIKKVDGFPGLPVDFDHYSDLDAETVKKLKALNVLLPSDAAGWMQDLEKREDGLWARIDFTPAGSDAVESGAYRFLSPVFPLSGVESMPGGKVRPRVISKAGLTNEPNLTGIAALSNRSGSAGLVGPACHIENRANLQQEKNTMDYKAKLLELIGGAPDLDDAGIEAGCAAKLAADAEMANKCANDAANADADQLEKEGFAIANRADVIPALIVNRDATIKAIKAMKPAAAVGSLPNRRDGSTPDPVSDQSVASDAKLKAIEAAQLANRCTRAMAYEIAERKNPELFK